MAKFKINKSFFNKISIFDKVARIMGKDKSIKSAIISDIESGVSPVQGQRFAKYSGSYKDAIRKGRVEKGIAPVNLKLSGDLLKSLTTDNIKSRIIISFEDEKASYHNEGNDKLPRRAILPTRSGEVFNKKIRNIIQKALKNALRKIFKK